METGHRLLVTQYLLLGFYERYFCVHVQEPDEEPQTAGPQQQDSSDCNPPSKQYVRSKHTCPICGERYADIVQHLRYTENVVNKTELSLLSKFSHRQ